MSGLGGVTVGVRELKNRLSYFLRQVAKGERVTVTDRGRPVAVISPIATAPDEERVWAMVREGLAEWAGGKPRGSARPPRITGRPVSDIVIEDRR